MKAAGAAIATALAGMVACVLGLVLVIAPAVGTSLDDTAAHAAPASGQLRPAAPVPEQYLHLVLAAGQLCPGIGPAHLAAQIEVESGWNPHAYADSGEVPAHGIAQFTMPTWATWGGDYQVEQTTTGLRVTGGTQPGDPYEPAHALIAQGRLMCDLHQWAINQLTAGRLTGADPLHLAWAAYFCGRGCLLAAGGIPTSGLAADYPGNVRTALTRYALAGPAAGAGGWVVPLPAGTFQRTSGYGPRTLGGQTRMHHGIDWAAPAGTPILAAADGTVIAAHCTSPRCDIPGHLGMPGSGLVVIIDHGAGVATLYAHASTLNVTTGQTVTAGQMIARVGSTGNSTGNHLHFQLHLTHPPINGQTAVDPDPYLCQLAKGR